MANPFGITQVDVPGVFGAVQQAKANALNFEIAKERLNAFRQEREDNKRRQLALQENLGPALEGDTAAQTNLAAAGVVDVSDIISLRKEDRLAAKERLDEGARLAFSALKNEDSFRRLLPKLRQLAPDFGIPAGAIPDNFEEAKDELEQFVALSEDAKQMFDVLDPKTTAQTVAFGTRDPETGQLVAEGIINKRDPNAIQRMNEAVAQNKVLFDPEQAGAGQGLTASQSGKRQVDFEAAEENTANLVKEMNRLEVQVQESGASVLGVSGGFARLVDNVAEQLRGAGELTGFRKEANRLLANTSEKTQGVFKDAANQSAALNSNLLSLAYLVAITRFGQEGRGLSDQDRQIALEIVGSAAQSPTQLQSTLNEVKRATVDQLETKAQAQGRDFDRGEFAQRFGLDLNISQPGQPQRGGFEQAINATSLEQLQSFRNDPQFMATLTREQKLELARKWEQLNAQRQ